MKKHTVIYSMTVPVMALEGSIYFNDYMQKYSAAKAFGFDRCFSNRLSVCKSPPFASKFMILPLKAASSANGKEGKVSLGGRVEGRTGRRRK